MKNKKTSIKKTKKKIPTTLRNTVWNTYIGIEKGIANCFCCKTEQISRANFDCGHVIAEENGGLTVLQNLRPICGHCNSSMGVKNMIKFMGECGFIDNAKIIKNNKDSTREILMKIIIRSKPINLDELMNGTLNLSEIKTLDNPDVKMAAYNILLNRCTTHMNCPIFLLNKGNSRDYAPKIIANYNFDDTPPFFIVYNNDIWQYDFDCSIMKDKLYSLIERSISKEKYEEIHKDLPFEDIAETKISEIDNFLKMIQTTKIDNYVEYEELEKFLTILRM